MDNVVSHPETYNVDPSMVEELKKIRDDIKSLFLRDDIKSLRLISYDVHVCRYQLLTIKL